jgi:hypothetical protein
MLYTFCKYRRKDEIMKKEKTEVIKLRLNRKVLELVREKAETEKRSISKQIEFMIMEGATVIDSKQPFIMAIFPQGADEYEIDKILHGINKLQILSTVQVEKSTINPKK